MMFCKRAGGPSLIAVNCLVWSCCIVTSRSLRADDLVEPSWYRSLLRSTTAVAQSREARLVSAHLREQVRRRWGDQSPRYGLSLLDPLVNTDHVVVFVHGYNSRPEALWHLVELVRRRGHAAAVFRYPNDAPLEESARRLSSLLSGLHRQHAGTSLILVTHSMGGLVARRMIEDAALVPGPVKRLIMIAPPNHGSALARAARGMDVAEYVLSATRRAESGAVSGSLLDGLAEAGLDLRPDSEFLRELNARPRNPVVKYTIVAGRGGPLRPETLELAQRLLNRAAQESTFARITFEELEVRVDDLEELLHGRGDGAVSLASARLNGVKDFVVGDFSHGDILLPGRSVEVRRIQQALLKRIDSTANGGRVLPVRPGQL